MFDEIVLEDDNNWEWFWSSVEYEVKKWSIKLEKSSIKLKSEVSS